jgi:hypothetical protein
MSNTFAQRHTFLDWENISKNILRESSFLSLKFFLQKSVLVTNIFEK